MPVHVCVLRSLNETFRYLKKSNKLKVISPSITHSTYIYGQKSQFYCIHFKNPFFNNKISLKQIKENLMVLADGFQLFV